MASQVSVDPDCTASVNTVAPEAVSVRVSVVPTSDALTAFDGDVVPGAAAMAVEVTVAVDGDDVDVEELDGGVEDPAADVVLDFSLPLDFAAVDELDCAAAELDSEPLSVELAAELLVVPEVDAATPALSARLCTPDDVAGQV